MRSTGVLAVLLSMAACVLAAFAMHRGTGADVSASSGPDEGRLQDISREVERLRADVDRLLSKPAEALAGNRQPVDRTSEPPQVPTEILDRLATLEKSVEALRRSPSPSPARAADSHGDAGDAHRVATDPAASADEKLAALKALRGQRIDGQDARTHDVILSMLDLAERSPDERTREDVYRNLHGAKDPALRDSMVRALANDPSAAVRSKVAEDIDTFLPDLVVENALRRSADGDVDDGVRAAALRTLSRKR